MKYSLKLKSKKEVAQNTMAFHFEKPSGFIFTPGQSMRLLLPGIDEEKTLSIVSAPHKDELIFAMRMTGSKFKNTLAALSIGKVVKAEGPFGTRFVLHNDVTKPAVFIAGGIGITPLLSILSWVVEEQLPYAITLFYSNRRREDIAYLGTLQQLEKQHTGITVVPTLTKEKKNSAWDGEVGHVDLEMIRKYSRKPMTSLYYIAGPPLMVMGMKKRLEESGVQGENIVTKKFTGY